LFAKLAFKKKYRFSDIFFKSMLVKLNLDAVNFEYFRCDEPKITIGVNMHNLHALLKSINDEDPIILYMNRDNRSILHIRSINEKNGSQETDIKIFLIEIQCWEFSIPKTEFQNKITIASDKFRTICEHLNNHSNVVEIISIDNEILFRGKNDGGEVTTTFKDINNNNKSNQVVKGTYVIKNLLTFSKFDKLCNIIEIYLKNDFPLVLAISMAALGRMYVFITPVTESK
jgi:proliferating cell nuclear antigen PCNA